MENMTIMGMILKKLDGFDNTYSCIGLEEVKPIGKGFEIKEGKYKSVVLPIFDNQEDISIFAFDGSGFIKNKICKDYQELKEKFVYTDRCSVTRE